MDNLERKKRAHLLVEQDKYPDALKEYAILLKENPKDSEIIETVLFLFSRILEGNYDFQPDTADEYVMRGISKFYHLEFEDSIDDYNKAINLKPDHDYAIKSKAFSLRSIGRIEEAIELCKQAITINPVGEYFDDLAELYDLIGETNLAFDNYKKAVKASPDEFRLWYNFGVHLMENRRYKEAIDKYEKALILWPQYEDAIVNRNWIYENFKEQL